MNTSDECRLIELAYLYMREIRELIAQNATASEYGRKRRKECYQVERTLDEYLKYKGLTNHINGLTEWSKHAN